MKQTLLMGFDIETGGPIIGKHPLLAIGFCVYKLSKDYETYEFIDSVEVHIDSKEEDYDQNTLKFWQNNPEAWKTILTNTLDPEKAADVLIQFLKKWQKYSIDNNHNLRMITDNCWYDNAFISWFLSMHGGNPLRENYFTGNNRLQNMIDINQRTDALNSDLGGICKLDKFIPSVPHDHTPVADARGIVEKYINYLKCTKKYTKSVTLK
jgi:hypothetical protein